MPEYLPRVVDKELALRLEAFGATLIVGPKWCGKTTTGEQQAKSILRMQDPDRREGYMATANTKPSLLLRGENPRLIDEWQVAPVLWDAVRTAVDQRQEEGLFILTGSTSVDNSKIMHSGTGRISRMKMYPMSLFESKESNGGISLKSLFNDPSLDIDGITSSLTIENLIFAACRGGDIGVSGGVHHRLRQHHAASLRCCDHDSGHPLAIHDRSLRKRAKPCLDSCFGAPFPPGLG